MGHFLCTESGNGSNSAVGSHPTRRLASEKDKVSHNFHGSFPSFRLVPRVKGFFNFLQRPFPSLWPSPQKKWHKRKGMTGLPSKGPQIKVISRPTRGLTSAGTETMKVPATEVKVRKTQIKNFYFTSHVEECECFRLLNFMVFKLESHYIIRF